MFSSKVIKNVLLEEKNGPSCVDLLEIWEPEPCGTLRACPGLYRDCFALHMWRVQRYEMMFGMRKLRMIIGDGIMGKLTKARGACWVVD